MENNMKAMREALDKIARCMDAILARTELDDPIHRKALEAQNIADGYLVAPARNCDLPNPDKRFADFCASQPKCSMCPYNKPTELRCDGAWLLAPAIKEWRD